LGGSNALHGKTLVLMGEEMVGDQLLMLAQFDPNLTKDLAHAHLV
jgi:hypothetical protein